MVQAKSVLITGITGFVGSHLADYLLEKTDCALYGLKRPNSRLRNIHHLGDSVKLLDGDLTDPTSMARVIGECKPDQIYHFGALSWVSPSFEMPSAYMHTNAIGTINLFEALRTLNLHPRILISCTPEEYGDVPEDMIPITEDTRIFPVNHYAASKVAQDAVCMSYHSIYNYEVIRTRAFNHEGPRRDIHGALASFAHQIALIERGLQETVVKVGNLNAKRNFTDVRDTVRAYHLAMEMGRPGELYLIGSQQIHTIRECLEMLISLSTKKDEIHYGEDPGRVRPTELNTLIGDISKFTKLTNWKPEITLQETLQSVLDYWREFIDRGHY